jgi:hypothetical protein
MSKCRVAEPFGDRLPGTSGCCLNLTELSVGEALAMDLAREVSFAETGEDDGRIVSCGLSLAEVIRYAWWNRCPLKRLDDSTTLPVSINAAIAKKCCPQYRCLQAETRKSKQLKPNTLAIVNFAPLCSYPLGMTCHPSTRCVAARF